MALLRTLACIFHGDTKNRDRSSAKDHQESTTQVMVLSFEEAPDKLQVFLAL